MRLRNMIAICSVVFAAATGSSIAAADPYFSVFGAYTDVDDFDFQMAPVTVTPDFDDGYGLGVAYGKRLGQVGANNRWRVEGELSYRSNDVDSHKLNGGNTITARANNT